MMTKKTNLNYSTPYVVTIDVRGRSILCASPGNEDYTGGDDVTDIFHGTTDNN